VSKPQFLVDSSALLEADTTLLGAELRHLRARRVSVGSEVLLTDGLGHLRRGIVSALDRHRATIRLIEEAVTQPVPSLRLVLAQVLLKASKTDMVIEKATELGVNDIIVLTSERSVARANPEHQARWQRIATSAAKQCGRASVPRIMGPTPFETLLDAATADVRLLFWEGSRSGGLAQAKAERACSDSVLAVVGPEGGFSTLEAAAAERARFLPISLGNHILRAETAAIVAVTLCQYLWGYLGEGRSSQPSSSAAQLACEPAGP